MNSPETDSCRGSSSPLFAAALLLATVLLSQTVQGEPISVTDCVRLALARAPATRAAGFEVDAASAGVRAAQAAYVPRLLAEANYGRSQGFDETVTNGGVTSALLTIEATLLDGGLRDAQFAAARARLRSASAMAQQRRADVALAVRAAYFNALAARTESGVHGEDIRTLRDYVGLLQRQETLGLAPHNDVLRARLAVETARTAERAADAQLAGARSELTLLTGVDVTPDALVEPAAIAPPQVTEALIDACPVLADARAAAEAACREADSVRSEWRGHLTLTASGGALGVQPGPTFHDNGGGQFLFGFTVPLYDGGGISARVAAAVAAARTAEANVEQSRQTIQIALARAGTEAARAQGDLMAWQRAIPQAQEDFQLMRARYLGGGNVRLLEVLDALNQYVDARLHVPQALLTYWLAVATQEQILGQVPTGQVPMEQGSQ
ncbi:MAG: TolC family protein [Candidatus Binatia bacterium]|jgi:outer membrane protein TolC